MDSFGAEGTPMFGLFKRGGGGAAQPSLDAVRFDDTGYAFQGEPQPGKVRVWHTPDGDGLGVYFFSVPPDLPANAGSPEELAKFYRRLLGDSGKARRSRNFREGWGRRSGELTHRTRRGEGRGAHRPRRLA
jgi:hypothetical protein